MSLPVYKANPLWTSTGVTLIKSPNSFYFHPFLLHYSFSSAYKLAQVSNHLKKKFPKSALQELSYLIFRKDLLTFNSSLIPQLVTVLTLQ